MTDVFQESRGFHKIASVFADDAEILFFFGGFAALALALEADKCAIVVVSKAVWEEKIETGYHAATAHEWPNVLDLGDAILFLWSWRKS